MAIASVGTTFSVGGSGISGDVKSISFGGVTASAIDVTTISSTSKAYVLGMVDGGTVSVSCFANSGSGNIPDLPTAGTNTLVAFSVTFGPVTAGVQRPIASFRGYMMSLTMSANVDEPVTADYEIRIAASAGTSGAGLLEAITWTLTAAGS